jgi:lysophospholipase L1-like esterase
LLVHVGAASAAAADLAPGQHWVASWGASQQLVEPANALPSELWRDTSLRQIVHLSLGGSRLRVRISNAYGDAPLAVDGATIALARPQTGTAGVDTNSLRSLTFGGRASVTIPAGAEYYSDSVDMAASPGADLAVSLYLNGEPARQTGHPGSRAQSYAAKGNRVSDAAWPQAAAITHWYLLADVEVQAPAAVGALVATGDSITDGYGVAPDSNGRWTDLLAARLRKENMVYGVVNAGIGGGRMLRDGLGTNLAARFDRDVLSRAGVTHALVLIGVNDLGGLHRNTPDLPPERRQLLAELMMAYRQLAARAHAHGVCLIGATLTPYADSGYYHPGTENEADRQALNEWIRHSGVFDAIADTDAALRDPAQPQRMLKAVDSGDGLHPSAAGYAAIAAAVPAAALRSSCRATDTNNR